MSPARRSAQSGAVLTPAGLGKELAAGQLRPAYLLAGPEPLYRDDALAGIRAAVLGDGPSEFNETRLDGARTNAGELSEAAHELPVFAERRLVVLREPEARRARAQQITDALVEVLAELREQQATTLVVLAARADKRSRWVKAFAAPAARVDCEAPRRSRDIAAFAAEEARRREIRLGPGAAEALAEIAGPQLLLLRQELEKAALLAGEGEEVSREHVLEGASGLAEEPIWDLTDAIGEGRGADALAILRRMLAAGAAPPMLLGALASHFRKLTRTSHGAAPRGSPWAMRKLESQASRYHPQRLQSNLAAIHSVDEVLKGQGALTPSLALERLVLNLSS